MNISKVIENVRRLKNGYDITDEQIIQDINTVEHAIIKNIFYGRTGDEAYTNFKEYNLTTDRTTELFAPAPYDGIYQQYCVSQIDLQYEDNRYNTAIYIYNNTFKELKTYWWRTHQQKRKYNYH